MRLSDTLAAPSMVVLQLLEQCNLRCGMCYEWGEKGAYHGREVAALELDVVLRTVSECLPSKPHFELFGGEPLLYPGIWEVIQRIREGGCELAFPTNGTLLEENAERLMGLPPNRLWLSVDGPEAINDRQRGKGVFKKAMRGLEKVCELRGVSGSTLPQLGITFVVTPSNHRHIEEFFLKELDLSQLAFVSIELQSYATEAQHQEYARLAADEFGVSSTPCAQAYVQDPLMFAEMDFEAISRQMAKVSQACSERKILFFSQPKTVETGNIKSYFSARWDAMADTRSRCGVPWLYAEISARGDVTTCHSFYDLPVGNIYEQSLLEIWRGERLQKVRAYLREKLFPICTACCRYYTGASAAPAQAKGS